MTTPAWRAAIVQPPCTACGLVPCSARSVSAESARPSPRPTSACGTIVQPQPAPGSRPSAARPPPMSTAPAAARIGQRAGDGASRAGGEGEQRHDRDGRRGLQRRSCRQPSISSSTSRNSAAVSAAEMRPRATLGPMRGRPLAGIALLGGVGDGPRSTGIASRAAGVWAMKIACHEIASVSSAAEGRADGGAERAGRGPGARPPAPRTRWCAAGAPAPRRPRRRRRSPARSGRRRASRSTAPARRPARRRRRRRGPTAQTSRGRRRPISAAGTATARARG